MTSKDLKTSVVHLGRDKKWTHGTVNPAVQRGSTIIFDSVEALNTAEKNIHNGALYYGRRGTHTHFALQSALSELEQGAGALLFPSGSAAIANSLLALLSQGDHLLMVDSCYGPTRSFCDTLLTRFGVSTTYYSPTIGAEIKPLIQPNTKVIFLESPGSITMEIQDVPTLSHIAKQHGVSVVMDNTWSAGVYFKALSYGVDVSIQSATKYIIGHSDAMMGVAVCNQDHLHKIRERCYLMGQCVSADDAYTALRGLRTLPTRLDVHQKNSLLMAKWLEQQPEVAKVLHPALASCGGHEFFKRDFTGHCGLFSFVMNQSQQAATDAMLNGMRYFSMGFSWGGFESLILAHEPDRISAQRSLEQTPFSGTLFRLHIGLESVEDLIDDLSEGFARYHAALSVHQR